MSVKYFRNIPRLLETERIRSVHWRKRILFTENEAILQIDNLLTMSTIPTDHFNIRYFKLVPHNLTDGFKFIKYYQNREK